MQFKTHCSMLQVNCTAKMLGIFLLFCTDITANVWGKSMWCLSHLKMWNIPIRPVMLCFWNVQIAVSCQCHLINVSLKPVFLSLVCDFNLHLCAARHVLRNLLVKSQQQLARHCWLADSHVSQSRGRALKRRLCQCSVQRHFIRPAQAPSGKTCWICHEQKREALRHVELWAESLFFFLNHFLLLPFTQETLIPGMGSESLRDDWVGFWFRGLWSN